MLNVFLANGANSKRESVIFVKVQQSLPVKYQQESLLDVTVKYKLMQTYLYIFRVTVP